MRVRLEGPARAVRAALALCALLASLLGVASCGGGGEGEGGRAPGVKSDGRPQRIISLSPSATEMLYGVGAFDRVVAVSNSCEYPPEVAELPRVGGWNNPNLEQVAALRPDLVVFAGALAPFIKDKLDALGVRTLGLPDQSVEDALSAVEQVGRATGNEEEGRRLASETRAKLDEVRALTANLPRRRVLCVVDRVPGTLRDLYAATSGSFLAQLLEAAGGESVAPPAAGGWGKIQKEAVVALDPEIIIDLMMQKAEGGLAEDTQAVWRELPQVSAVREGRVYAVRHTSVLHPSQFVGDTARRFAELIHPEAFGKR